jgi:hypothetical protein
VDHHVGADNVGLGLEAKVSFLQVAEAFYEHQLKHQGYNSEDASAIPVDVVGKP